MALYVVDTHALLWYLGGSPLVSPAARAALDEAASGTSQVIVPAIVIAELVMLAEKRRISLNLNRVVATLQANPNFRVTSLSPEIALHTQTLTALRDIHDRLIVAEAQAAGAALITRDEAITASGLVKTVW